MSPSVKKGPVMIYRPGVGTARTVCCKPPLEIFLDGGIPAASGSIIYDGGTPMASGANIDGGKP
jgi:hypothetical protein